MLTSRNALGTCFTDRAFNFRVIGERSVSHYTESGNISLLYNAFPQRLILITRCVGVGLTVLESSASPPQLQLSQQGRGMQCAFPRWSLLGPDKCTTAEIFFPVNSVEGLAAVAEGLDLSASILKHCMLLRLSQCSGATRIPYFFQIPQWNKHMLHF